MVFRMVNKIGGKSLRRPKKPHLSVAMVQKCQEKSSSLLHDLKNRGNRILSFSYEKTFTVAIIFNKQIDRVVTIENDVSEYRKVSTTKHSASIMMPGVVALNGLH